MGVYIYDQGDSSIINSDNIIVDSTKALTGKDAENSLPTKANTDGSITCRLYKLSNSGHVFFNINNSRFIAKTNHSINDDNKHAVSNFILAQTHLKK
uniref:DUF1521 domain-containing protein n=1 Tax=Strongyloides papillosus TaxID=174720 RepID=A0A0N5C9V5_STREA